MCVCVCVLVKGVKLPIIFFYIVSSPSCSPGFENQGGVLLLVPSGYFIYLRVQRERVGSRDVT